MTEKYSITWPLYKWFHKAYTISHYNALIWLIIIVMLLLILSTIIQVYANYADYTIDTRQISIDDLMRHNQIAHNHANHNKTDQKKINQINTDPNCNAKMPEWILKRIKILEQTVATLQTNITLITSQLVIATKATKLDNADTSPTNPNTTILFLKIQQQQLALGLLQLNILILTDKPFMREFRLVQKLGAKEARLRVALDNLAPHAVTGVATIAQLRDGFGLIILPKLNAIMDGEQPSFARRTWSWFINTAVPIWEQNPATPSTELTHNIINAAMNRLSEDNLPDAVNMLTQLNGPAARLTARWLIEAQARLKLNVAYENISNTILALLNAH
ncbi:hypothetical protein TI05_12980 [Achromatium sp. WMS3]|nr:hypothetical protein TI05_12980 [Achromatium sp. WMS3]